MATYGKPTTSFYVNYGRLDPIAAQRALAPVLIAPRYKLHNVGDDDAYLGEYSLLDTSAVLAWPGFDPKSTNKIDTKTVKVILRNVGIVSYKGTLGEITVNKNEISGISADIEVSVGDLLICEGLEFRAEVTGVAEDVITLDAATSSLTSTSDVKLVSFKESQVLGEVELESEYFTLSSTGISLSAAAKIGDDIIGYGDVYVEYREFIQEGCLELRTNLHTETADWVGDCDPRNPMGMMHAAAQGVSNEAFFYLVSVAGDEEQDYIDAVNYVGQFEDCYAPIVFKQTRKTQQAVLNMINKYSNPQIAWFKRSWFCVPEDMDKVIYDVNADGKKLRGTIKNSVLTLTAGADLYKAKVVDGDFVQIAGGEYMIEDVLSSTEVQLAGNPPESTSAKYAVFVRDYAGADYAQYLADMAAAINSERINFVVCDRLSFAGFDNVSPAYACAALAAQRAALPPHAPMNDMQLPGFTLGNDNRWTDIDYEIMNNGGCWVLYRDIEGRTLTYHQITTKTDGTIAEEDSVVSNGDSIVRTLRKAVVYLCGGKGNATQALLDEIRVSLAAAFKQIESEVYPAIYGPRIVDWSIAKLYIPEGNKRSVMCDCDVETPQPTQDSRFNFNLF